MEPQGVAELIRQELAPILDGLKAELIEFSFKRPGSSAVLQILVDKEGGITVDECALINKRLGDIIEEKSLINERYVLEVSSPGIDRPLKTKRDFERVIGKEVDIWILKPQAVQQGKSFSSGKVKTAGEKDVTIEAQRNGNIVIPYEAISKAIVKL